MTSPSAARTPRRPRPPLDAAALERLALRYVERYATSRGRLANYLRRKIRERGWEGEAADPAAIAERMANLGYLDDRGFAEGRAASLARRGLGARRVAQAWAQAGIGAEDRAALDADVRAQAYEAAQVFARRRRIGPFAAAPADPDARRRQIAAMLRAGHSLDLARRIVALAPGEEFPEPF